MVIMMNVDMMSSLYYDIIDFTKTAKLFTTNTISELLSTKKQTLSLLTLILILKSKPYHY